MINKVLILLNVETAMKSRHPFMSLNVAIPKDKEESVDSISSWLSFQPHLPKLSDEMILLFLHSCYYSLERTKDTIDSYYTLRARATDLFTNWDFDHLNQMWNISEMSPLPVATSEGYMIILYRLKDFDPAKLNFNELTRAFCAFNDCKISEDGLKPGYIVILDMKGVTFGHLLKVTPCLQTIKMLLIYLQECHPVRLKQVHVINTFNLIDRILDLVKPFIQLDLMNILHLHSNPESLSEFFSLDLLPAEYGGKQLNATIMHNEFNKTMESRYKQWLKECEKMVADEKKRIGKPRKNITGSELEGSFRKLEID